MPQSYVSLHYHQVFSTKNREPLIYRGIRKPLYAYLGGILENQKGVLLAAGGIEDHVHLLVGLNKERSLTESMRDIKANSSGWIHEHFTELQHFRWQAGYGAFTVGRSEMDVVREYIATQEAHHRTEDFKAEFRRLLDEHGIPYDERYLWE